MNEQIKQILRMTQSILIKNTYGRKVNECIPDIRNANVEITYNITTIYKTTTNCFRIQLYL